MVRSAHRVTVVHGKMDLAVAAPAVRDDGKKFPFPHIEHREIPQEDVDVQLAATLRESIQKSVKLPRKTLGPLIMHETNPAVEVPPHDNNGLASRLCGTDKGVEVRRAINQKSYAIRRQELPTIAPFATKSALLRRRPRGKMHAETMRKIWTTR
jgi:hypothetical protein